MAWRAGAASSTWRCCSSIPQACWWATPSPPGGLLEEGLRGAGARLFNGWANDSWSVTIRQRLERATRDVISRSSLPGNHGRARHPSDGIYLDAATWAKSSPGTFSRAWWSAARTTASISCTTGRSLAQRALSNGRSTNRHRLPHESGGIFVAGEDAGGVHGANRLGGNGVADSIVYGARAGDRWRTMSSRRCEGGALNT